MMCGTALLSPFRPKKYTLFDVAVPLPSARQ